MSWALIDDRFGDHPKVEALEAMGGRIHAEAVSCWLLLLADSKDRGTAGLVTPERLAKRLHCWSPSSRKRAASALVQVGLWIAQPDGSWLIHDFDDYGTASERPEGEAKPRGPKTPAERARDCRARRKERLAAEERHAERHDGVTASVTDRNGERDEERDAARDGASRLAQVDPHSLRDGISGSDTGTVTRAHEPQRDDPRDAASVTPSRPKRAARDAMARSLEPVRPSEFRERLALAWNAKHHEITGSYIGAPEQLARAARGTPLRGQEKLADHLEALALWCEAQPDPDVALERVLTGFYADRWATQNKHPLGALASAPQKYVGRVLPKAEEYADDAEDRIAALGATQSQLELAAKGRRTA